MIGPGVVTHLNDEGNDHQATSPICLPAPTFSTNQLRARESFDLDAAMASLPLRSKVAEVFSHKGRAGVRLQSGTPSRISDELLGEFARGVLRAERCSKKYLEALRNVLGNQARAERYGYVLEMNQRAPIATERIMRTILDQMDAAKISSSRSVSLGNGRTQEVRCYGKRRVWNRTTLQEEEARNDARRERAIFRGEPLSAGTFSEASLGLDCSDLPY